MHRTADAAAKALAAEAAARHEAQTAQLDLLPKERQVLTKLLQYVIDERRLKEIQIDKAHVSEKRRLLTKLSTMTTVLNDDLSQLAIQLGVVPAPDDTESVVSSARESATRSSRKRPADHAFMVGEEGRRTPKYIRVGPQHLAVVKYIRRVKKPLTMREVTSVIDSFQWTRCFGKERGFVTMIKNLNDAIFDSVRDNNMCVTILKEPEVMATIDEAHLPRDEDNKPYLPVHQAPETVVAMFAEMCRMRLEIETIRATEKELLTKAHEGRVKYEAKVLMVMERNDRHTIPFEEFIPDEATGYKYKYEAVFENPAKLPPPKDRFEEVRELLQSVRSTHDPQFLHDVYGYPLPGDEKGTEDALAGGGGGDDRSDDGRAPDDADEYDDTEDSVITSDDAPFKLTNDDQKEILEQLLAPVQDPRHWAVFKPKFKDLYVEMANKKLRARAAAKRAAASERSEKRKSAVADSGATGTHLVNVRILRRGPPEHLDADLMAQLVTTQIANAEQLAHQVQAQVAASPAE